MKRLLIIAAVFGLLVTGCGRNPHGDPTRPVADEEMCKLSVQWAAHDDYQLHLDGHDEESQALYFRTLNTPPPSCEGVTRDQIKDWYMEYLRQKASR